MKNLLILSLIILTQSCNSPVSDLSVVDCGQSCPEAPLPAGQSPLISLISGTPPTLVNGVAITPINFNIENAELCEIQSGFLPNGLTLDQIGCNITGTPIGNTSLSGYSFTIAAVQGSYKSSTLALTLRVRALIVGASTITAQVNSPISIYTVTSNQTLNSCSFGGAAVPGLTYNTTLCTISGTPTTIGSTVNTITGINANGNSNAVSVTVNVTAAAPVITASTTAVDTKRNSPMSAVTFTTTQAITSCSYSGTLPTGMSFNTSTCAINGTPSAQTNLAGLNVTVTATGAGGSSNSVVVNLKVYKNYCDGLGATGSNANLEPLNDGNSSSAPYILCGTDGLVFLNTNASAGKFFKLQSDVNLAGTAFSATNSFNGSLDGAGHTISNQATNSAGTVNGLFKTVTTATIKNLTISNSEYVNTGVVGTLIGQVTASGNATLTNIIVKDSRVDTESNQSLASGLLVGNVVPGASITLTNILAYQAGVSTSATARVMVGKSDNSSRSYTRVVYEDSLTNASGYVADEIGLLNVSGTPGSLSPQTFNDISNQASVYTGFPTSVWDLSPVATNSPATLIVSKHKVYLDGHN